MKYNMNDHIRVRLTDEGRRIHRANYEAFISTLPESRRCRFPYSPVVEDDDGWSLWQGWDLMQQFGPWLGPFKTLPFDLTVDIVQTTKGSDAQIANMCI